MTLTTKTVDQPYRYDGYSPIKPATLWYCVVDVNTMVLEVFTAEQHGLASARVKSYPRGIARLATYVVTAPSRPYPGSYLNLRPNNLWLRPETP